jgi:hypothetical protein
MLMTFLQSQSITVATESSGVQLPIGAFVSRVPNGVLRTRKMGQSVWIEFLAKGLRHSPHSFSSTKWRPDRKRTNTSCKIWGFNGGDYEECRLLRYKNPVRTSQETNYVSTTEPSRLMLCKIWGFHGGDCEECRLLGYKNPVLTSQETHYITATESSRLMLCKSEVFTAVTMKNVVFWDIITRFVLHRRHITSPLQSPAS